MNKLRESRALPGGMLNSKEKTEYEDWLEKIHSEIDKNKTDKDSCPIPLFDSDQCANGCHNDDGSLMKEKKDKEKKLKIFESTYYESLGFKGLHDFKEAVKSIVMFGSHLTETLDDDEKVNELSQRVNSTVLGLQKEMTTITSKKGLDVKQHMLQAWFDNFEDELSEAYHFYKKFMDLGYVDDETKQKTSDMFMDYAEAWRKDIYERMGGTNLFLTLKNTDGTDFNLDDFSSRTKMFKLMTRIKPEHSVAYA